MNFLKAINWQAVLFYAVTALVLFGLSYGSYRLANRTPPPTPAPQLIEWEVDKEFGDKRTTLPNGLKLYVYKVDDTTSTETTWGWTVGSEGMTEREAVDRALHMGGVK